MKGKHLFVVGFCVAAFCGCLTEQELKEYARAQAIVSEVQNCLSTGDYQKATQLCDQGEKECPSVDYDWREAKATVVAHKKASEDARTAMVAARKKRLEDSWNQMAVLNALNVIEQCKDKYGRDIGTINPHRITMERDSHGNVIKATRKGAYDWLNTWIGPRTDVSVADAQAGEALLEEFASKYLPNAFNNYEKCRERAHEVSEMFRENYPDPYAVMTAYWEAHKKGDPDPTSWDAYQKTLIAYSKARTQYFRRRDELCHLYISWKCGAINATALSAMDSSRLEFWMLENKLGMQFPLERLKEQKVKERDFASKYMPESASVLSRMQEDYDATIRLYDEVVELERKLDVVRVEMAEVAIWEKLRYLGDQIEKARTNISEAMVEHATTISESDSIAAIDHKLALQLIAFEKSMKTYVVDRANGPLINSSISVNKYYDDANQGCYRTDLLQPWHFVALGFRSPGSCRNMAVVKEFSIYPSYSSGYGRTGDQCPVDSLDMSAIVPSIYFETGICSCRGKEPPKWSTEGRARRSTGRIKERVGYGTGSEANLYCAIPCEVLFASKQYYMDSKLGGKMGLRTYWASSEHKAGDIEPNAKSVEVVPPFCLRLSEVSPDGSIFGVRDLRESHLCGNGEPANDLTFLDIDSRRKREGNNRIYICEKEGCINQDNVRIYKK